MKQETKRVIVTFLILTVSVVLTVGLVIMFDWSDSQPVGEMWPPKDYFIPRQGPELKPFFFGELPP